MHTPRTRRSRTIRTRAARTTAALAVVAGCTVAAAGVASAEGSTTTPTVSGARLEQARSRCVAGIDQRIGDLAAWSIRIGELQHLGADQKASLQAELADVTGGLQNVALPAVQAATDRTSLEEACRAVVEDYRVYRVVRPEVTLTAHADSLTAVIADVQAKADELAAAGADTSAAEALLDEATDGVAEAMAAIEGVSPDAYNADPEGTTAAFHAARAALQEATADVRAAVDTLRTPA